MKRWGLFHLTVEAPNLNTRRQNVEKLEPLHARAKLRATNYPDALTMAADGNTSTPYGFPSGWHDPTPPLRP